jgi:hypothetical protein
VGYAVRQLAFQSVALNSWLSILSPQFLALNPYPLILASQICASRSSAPTLPRSDTSVRRFRSSALGPVLSIQHSGAFDPALPVQRTSAQKNADEGGTGTPGAPELKWDKIHTSSSRSPSQPPSCDPPRLQGEHHIPVD